MIKLIYTIALISGPYFVHPTRADNWLDWGRSFVNGTNHLLHPTNSTDPGPTLDEDPQTVWQRLVRPWIHTPDEPAANITEPQKTWRQKIVGVWESWTSHTPQTNDTQEIQTAHNPYVNRQSIDDDNDGGGAPIGIGAADIVATDSESERLAKLLPSQDILTNLRCRPAVSFGSCVEHCMKLVPPSDTGYSLSNALMFKKAEGGLVGRRLEEEPGKKNSKERIGAEMSFDVNETPRGFSLWEITQIKGCVTSICAEDYLHKPVPGCLDARGLVVMTRRGRVPSPDGNYTRLPSDFDDLDFYDPGRLNFWHDMGFFKLQKLWFDLTHKGGATSIASHILLPIVLATLLSLPILMLVLIIPGLTSLPEGNENFNDILNHDGSVTARTIGGPQAMCDDVFVKSSTLRRLKAFVDALTFASQKATALLRPAVANEQEILIEMQPSHSNQFSTASGIPEEGVKALGPHLADKPGHGPSHTSSTIPTAAWIG
eukprot:Blabericola_migrator_1__12936@NODE_853_length_6253_cov_534_155512_g604_i0_p2_GENE_NODE_853_length_6253_cov_534_155512_g604_i0NODE_853_length_6253_cov_534_155512_g604_i0_p2_ORF_typecomplete_len486_score117_04_NODE_853_length_6253_cov_534_155512_g604_i01381595